MYEKASHKKRKKSLNHYNWQWAWSRHINYYKLQAKAEDPMENGQKNSRYFKRKNPNSHLYEKVHTLIRHQENAKMRYNDILPNWQKFKCLNILSADGRTYEGTETLI